MSKYETVEVPFKLAGNRRCLTEKQLAESPWLMDFYQRFEHCFEASPVSSVVWLKEDE